MYVILQRSL